MILIVYLLLEPKVFPSRILQEEEVYLLGKEFLQGQKTIFIQRNNIVNTGMNGHTMSNCFKIHGYPDWYEDLKNKRPSNRVRANLVNKDMESPLDCDTSPLASPEESLLHSNQTSLDLTAIIQREIAKYLQNPAHVPQAHFAQTQFAGHSTTPIHDLSSFHPSSQSF